MTGAWLNAAIAAGLGRLRARGLSLAVEQVLPLDGRRRLCIVRCDGRRVLLLVGGGQDVVVGWLDDTAAAAAAP